MAELAVALGLSESTIRRRPELMVAIEKGREAGKTTLRRWMWKAAENGNIVMQIWLSKNLLGYTDRAMVEQTNRGGVVVVPGTLSPEDWTAAMAERAANRESDSVRVGKWLHGRFVGDGGDNGSH